MLATAEIIQDFLEELDNIINTIIFLNLTFLQLQVS